MKAVCASHAGVPMADTPAKADLCARSIIRHAPAFVPEFMWDTSYPASTCCTRSALAYSLVHAAIARMLNERN